MSQINLFDESASNSTEGFVVLDTETTGLNEKNGYVIEVAARRDDGETFESLICPITPNGDLFFLPQVIVEITNITDEMVALAPPATEVIPKFLDFIGDRIMVAHNAPFDKKFLKEEASRLGIVFEPDFIDTASLARHFYPDIEHAAGKSKYTLENLCAVLNIVNASAHRAFADVDATFELFTNHLQPLCNTHNLNPINFYVNPRSRRRVG